MKQESKQKKKKKKKKEKTDDGIIGRCRGPSQGVRGLQEKNATALGFPVRIVFVPFSYQRIITVSCKIAAAAGLRAASVSMIVLSVNNRHTNE